MIIFWIVVLAIVALSLAGVMIYFVLDGWMIDSLENCKKVTPAPKPVVISPKDVKDGLK